MKVELLKTDIEIFYIKPNDHITLECEPKSYIHMNIDGGVAIPISLETYKAKIHTFKSTVGDPDLHVVLDKTSQKTFDMFTRNIKTVYEHQLSAQRDEISMLKWKLELANRNIWAKFKSWLS